MEINLGILGTQQVESTTERKKMKLSANASQMVFKMFTKNVYSNPIGTVVREITSNCFDSHVEAGVKNTPVLIKKSHDEITDTHYISFIDYGVGMSPERIENIYGVYFESTKRNTNEEIGGFGIGGKTPLAYMRNTGEGEGEYDNSFFVITNFEGTKYYYNVFEGSESPEFTLFHSEETTERNGTEIRIPVLSRDISKFESEMIRQLFYFEGIVFEGFGESLTNDYQIVRGKTFLYRPNCFDNKVHVCLGRVYYPIDYNVLGLDSYQYQIPVAINVPIGAIGMTVSREQLDYSESTIKYLKNALESVKDELKSMLAKQYNNVQTLEQYFVYRTNFGHLQLTPDHSIKLSGMIKQTEVNLKKFKYNGLFKQLPDTTSMFKTFFTTKIFGKPENKTYRSDGYYVFNTNYEGLKEMSQKTLPSLYCSEPTDFKITRIKQSYLKSKHTRYYVVIPKDLRDTSMYHNICDTFNVSFDTHEDMLKSELFTNIMGMQEDYMEIVRRYAPDYSMVEVPENFSLTYGKKRLSSELLKQSIPVQFSGRSSKERVPVKELINFRGKIFYTTNDDRYTLENAYNVHRDIFSTKHIVNGYSSWQTHKFGKNTNIMFVSMAKGNIKFMEYCKNAIEIKNYYHKFLYRKEEMFKSLNRNEDIVTRYDQIDDFYKSELFAKVAPEWAESVKLVKTFKNNLEGDFDIIKYYKQYLSKYINFDGIVYNEEEKDVCEKLDDIEFIQGVNREALQYIKTPDRHWNVVSKEQDEKILPELLKKVLTL